MPESRTSRPERARALVLVTAFTAAVAVFLPTTGAAAAKPVAEPATGGIAVTVTTNIDDAIPAASGTPELLVEADRLFTVTARFTAGPYSNREATELVVETSSGALTGTTTPSVAAGESSVDFTVQLPIANAVVLTVRPVEVKAARELGTGSSQPFDLVTDIELVVVADEDREDPLVVTRTGNGVPCQATPEVPTCVDVLLPNGVDSNVFFSTGSCVGVSCSRDELPVLQVLADIEGLYGKQAPATLVVKCDKLLCGGGAIQRNVLRASLEATGPLGDVPACATKGVIGPTQESCVDYVQSKRDGSGDTYLYWLVTRDARMSF